MGCVINSEVLEQYLMEMFSLKIFLVLSWKNQARPLTISPQRFVSVFNEFQMPQNGFLFDALTQDCLTAYKSTLYKSEFLRADYLSHEQQKRITYPRDAILSI